MKNEFFNTLVLDASARIKKDLSSLSVNKKKKIIRKLRKKYKLFNFQYYLRLKYFTSPKSILGLFARVMVRRLENKYSINIPNIPIGGGLHIVHAGNIFLNAESIGENFTCYQGVTLGTSGNGRVPTIKSNVTCYTNSVVCGDIVVGDNVRIGANAFVNFDVKDNSTVINQCIVKEKDSEKV
ncbi:MAG: hypothetical protein MJ066_02260 [Clostridia bacterium]|nr:hypothetical protein [Clostridia bacterium]